jgi:hypothetical protein
MAPEWLESLARSCPVSPGGVHQWLASFVARSYHYLGAEEQMKILYWATADCGRPMQSNEIENTVENVRRWRGDRINGYSHESPWASPVPEVIDEIVLQGITTKALRSRSPWKLRKLEAPGIWLPRLFPVDTLLCLSHEVLYPAPLSTTATVHRQWRTRRLYNWVGRYRHDCDTASLLVPNPAVYVWGWTKGANRHRSTRCEQMFPERKYYLVVEFDFAPLSRDDTRKTDWTPHIEKWSKRGLSVKDACAALLWHLQQYLPLVLVIWSGKKSLQGWFNVQDVPTDLQRRFLDYACGLNADRVTWTTCQLIRMPGAIRPENNARQTVEYFDPGHLPRF